MTYAAAVLVSIVLLFAVPVAAEYSNPYHANIAGVDYSTDDGETFTFWVTIYSEDDTGNSTPERWEAWDEDDTVIISHEIVDPVEEDDAPRIHSEAVYDVPEGVDVLVFRGYDSEHGYGGATVTVDFAAQDFRQDDADTTENGGGEVNGDEDEENGNGAGPAPGGEDDPDADGTVDGTDGDTDEETDEDEDSERTVGDRVLERLPGLGEDTEDGTGPVPVLLLVAGLTLAGILGYRRYNQ